MRCLRLIIALVVVAIVSGFRANMQMKAEMPSLKKVAAGVIAGIFASNLANLPANAISKTDLDSLSYLQVKGTGLANRCPEATGTGSISVSGKKYKITDLCLEPTTWQVEEQTVSKKGEVKKELVNTKLMTRQTYSLDGVSGSVDVKDGKLVFTEEDGIDYAATTVQLPGGERVPFLFSVKDLVAKGNGPVITPGLELGGSFTVPSYRTGLFLDPKGRGTTTGYDFAGALPGLQNGQEGVGEEALFEENNKKFDVLTGDIELAVKNVNVGENEFSGVFVSSQPSDTDMGGKKPKQVIMKGIWYGRVEAQ